jgi:predicted acetyltransferase
MSQSDGIRVAACPHERVSEFLRPIAWTLAGRDVEDEPAQRFARLMPEDRMLAAFEGDEVVGAAGSFAYELTVPGGAMLPASGISVVAVLPTHRRRGVLTRLMRTQLDDARRRGEPLAALYASEEQIYGRFGYGVASQSMAIEVERGARLLAPQAAGVTSRLLDADGAAAVLPAVYERLRVQRVGVVSRSAAWWTERRLRDAGSPDGALRRVVVELDGVPSAYALYRLAMRWEDGIARNGLRVLEAVGATPLGTREVWRYLLSIDLVEQTTADHLPLDHPLLFLLAEPRRVHARVRDGLWVRLVDVQAALAGRRYACEGSLVLEVADAFCPHNAGRWRLDVREDGRATVTGTSDTPDLALDVAQLATPYLGAFGFEQLAGAGRVEERTAGAAARADGLFHWSPAPWCVEMF